MPPPLVLSKTEPSTGFFVRACYYICPIKIKENHMIIKITDTVINDLKTNKKFCFNAYLRKSIILM